MERGAQYAVEEAIKVRGLSQETGVEIGHIMIPGMIDEDDDRPIEMKPKMDVLEYWSLIRPELPECPRAVHPGHLVPGRTGAARPAHRTERRDDFDGIAFVGVPRTAASDGEGGGVAPTDALSTFATPGAQPRRSS